MNWYGKMFKNGIRGGKVSFRTECTLFYLCKENAYTFVNVRKYLGKKYTKPPST